MDAIDLRGFYASPLGAVARRLIAHRIRSHWHSLGGRSIAGIGYVTPFLDGWRDEAAMVAGLMPARQGVVHWPVGGPCVTTLVDEAELPLPDASIDRVLVVHGLETSESLPEFLREVWRVLTSDGSVLLVVPNRRGMWARFDRTPFGHGRPFSRGQLTQYLRNAMLSPSGWSQALFVPPFDRGFLRRSATAWGRLGLWLWPAFSGVIIVEATKQVYAVSPGRRVRRWAGALQPALRPAGATPQQQAFQRRPLVSDACRKHGCDRAVGRFSGRLFSAG